MGELKELKEIIVKGIEKYQVVSDKALDASTLCVYEYTDDQIKRAISELVQANEIRRYEYILSNEHTRRSFYMPLGSRLMI